VAACGVRTEEEGHRRKKKKDKKGETAENAEKRGTLEIYSQRASRVVCRALLADERPKGEGMRKMGESEMELYETVETVRIGGDSWATIRVFPIGHASARERKESLSGSPREGVGGDIDFRKKKKKKKKREKKKKKKERKKKKKKKGGVMRDRPFIVSCENGKGEAILSHNLVPLSAPS